MFTREGQRISLKRGEAEGNATEGKMACISGRLEGRRGPIEGRLFELHFGDAVNNAEATFVRR